MSLLPKSSIRNLIVNRSMRPVCEQGLYQSIQLSKHSRRSIRLLQTFLLRPDLALLVQHLEIKLDSNLKFRRQIPSPLQVDAVRAISLAKNVQSLSLRGPSDWVWKSDKDELRQVVSDMKLVQLEIPILGDPYYLYKCPEADDWKYWARQDVELGAGIRRLLHAQPLLEEFKLSKLHLPEKNTPKIIASLQACLQASDVPSLKSLQATPEFAIVFLPRARRLESLNLTLASWNDRLLSDMEIKAAAIKLSIRSFTIRVWSYHHDQWFWDNLANVFALFPNIEHLSVTIDSGRFIRDAKPAEFYFTTA
ncbi:hypothetical protein FRC01_008809, partial [Tulasnella sp. 417]